MTTRFRRAGAALITLVVIGLAAPMGATQTIDPTVSLDRTGTVKGDEMLVTGAGWPEGSTVAVELCGHGGIRGAIDCDLPHQRTAGVGSSGTFSVQLITGTPPQPCPCVVKVTDQTTHIAATAPIAVAGIPTVAITDDDGGPERAVEISSIDVTGGGSIAELFGAGARRVLEVTLVNTGAVPVDAPDVSVAWGTGSDPDGFVAPQETKRLEPGETETLTFGLDRPALTVGEQTAVVEVQGFGEPVVARASTTGYPWGLLVVALLVLQLLLLRLRNRGRRRLARRSPPDGDDPVRADEVLALGAGPAALGPGSDEAPSDDRVVIDLDEVQRQSVTTTGGDPTSARALPAGAVVGAIASGAEPLEHDLDPDEARLRARIAVRRAAQLSEALVAAAGIRLQELEDQAATRLRDSEARHAEALDALELAKAQADDVVATATAAAAWIRLDAEADRDAAREALSDLEDQRREWLVTAVAAVNRMADELDEAVAAGPEPPSAPAAPRLGGLEHRVADALSRAIADSSVGAVRSN